MAKAGKNPAFDSGNKDVKEEAEEKGGGKQTKKRVGGPVGASAHSHGGRAARKSGGACESHLFSSANAGSPAPGRKLMSKKV